MTDIDAYIQVTAASTWLAAHLVDYASWTAATSDQKAAALIEASDHIDSLFERSQIFRSSRSRIPPNPS